MISQNPHPFDNDNRHTVLHNKYMHSTRAQFYFVFCFSILGKSIFVNFFVDKTEGEELNNEC